MMQHRRYGKTEIQMPVLTCGGMRYQHAWKDPPEDPITEKSQKNVEAIIARARELEINHVETARGYGTSERQLGRIWPRLDRESMIFQTKGGPQKDPKVFRENLEDSFKRVRIETLDLFGVHGINNDETLDRTVRKGGCMDVLREFQRDGRIRHIGFSSHGPTEIIVKTIETGEFDYVNLHWYYINQMNWPAIESAAKLDMGVFIISPSDKGGRLYEPPQKLVDLCAPLSPMVFNDLFCLNRPEVHTLSIGASRPTDFDEHMKVLPLLGKADETLPPIEAKLKKAFVDAFDESWWNSWSVALPRWQDTPGEMNLPVILTLYNCAKAWDMVEYGRYRYNLFGGGGHWFPGQSAEMAREYDLREALKDSPHADRIPDMLVEAHEILAGEKQKRLSKSGS